MVCYIGEQPAKCMTDTRSKANVNTQIDTYDNTYEQTRRIMLCNVKCKLTYRKRFFTLQI